MSCRNFKWVAVWIFSTFWTMQIYLNVSDISRSILRSFIINADSLGQVHLSWWEFRRKSLKIDIYQVKEFKLGKKQEKYAWNKVHSLKREIFNLRNKNFMLGTGRLILNMTPSISFFMNKWNLQITKRLKLSCLHATKLWYVFAISEQYLQFYLIIYKIYLL